MAKRRNYTIFIVDPEPESLQRYKEQLAGLPHFICYCTSFKEASAIMAGVTADVIMCRHLPGDPALAKFLLRIQQRHPNCVRMLYGDKESVSVLGRYLACGAAHRVFVHPCEKAELRARVTRDLLTRDRLRVQECWEFLENGNLLPSLPTTVNALEEVLSDPEYTIEELVAVIERDPVIASRLLQVVNSAAFYKNSAIGTLSHAIIFLGLSLLREILLFISAMEVFPPPQECRFRAIRISLHSMQCSKLARLVAKDIAPGHDEEAAVAALLHDFGKLIFVSGFCARYREVAQSELTEDCSSSEYEEKVFGISHTQLGGCLMLWWNMPFAIAETAANHDLPLTDLWGIPQCVAIADRCLLEAASEGRVKTDLDTLPADFPLAKWQAVAKKLVDTLG